MATRLERVIEEVKAFRTILNKAWIFNDEGKIADNVMCCDVLNILDELKEYEINVSDKWIENFRKNEKTKGDNTYNYNCNISNDLNMDYLTTKDDEEIILFMVHLYGDIRGGYSEYFVVKFDYEGGIFELENATQIKDVNETMYANLNAFSEAYMVYDYEKQEEVGYFYESELEVLLNEIAEQES